MNDFDITHSQTNSIEILSISGELDAHTTTQLEDCLKKLIDNYKYNIVIDCTALEYIASAGLGVFMAYIQDIRNLGGDIKFSGMNERVFSVFDLLGFNKLYTIVEKTNQAIAEFNLT